MVNRDGVLLHDPTAGIACHRPDDRFIPVRAGELAAALAEDAARFGASSETLVAVARAVEEVIGQEVSAFERALAERYTAFNPDRDTVSQADVNLARTPEGYRDLGVWLDYLLAKANFVQLTEAQIHSAVATANSFGLRVRLEPDRLAHLSIWIRGHAKTHRPVRTWRHPIRGEERELIVYRRLAIIARLKNEPYVNLKLFKEIPTADVEALLPHADVRMTWFDQLKLFGGGAGVVGSTGLKVFNLVKLVVLWSRLLWVVLVGAAMLTYRAITGYRYARTMRESMRTKNLYYQNLDNNAGVIHALSSMIAQEEVKEAILAYCFCLDDERAVSSAEELQARVEAFLSERFGVTVNFDVLDALETLARFGLWTDRSRLRVLGARETARRLREHWTEGRSLGYHQTRATSGTACGSSPTSRVED